MTDELNSGDGAFPDVPPAQDIGTKDPVLTQAMAEQEAAEHAEQMAAQAQTMEGFTPQSTQAPPPPMPGQNAMPESVRQMTRGDDGAVKYMEPVDAQSHYGPFLDYTLVTTPYGEFAVPVMSVMWFEHERVFNRKEGMWEDRMVPKYEKVHVNDPRLMPDKTVQAADVLAASTRRR